MKSWPTLALAVLAASGSVACEEDSPLGTAGVPGKYPGHMINLQTLRTPRTALAGDDASETGTLGQLQPQPLVDAADAVLEVTGMAVTAQHLYFTVSWEGIYRIAKHGGNVESVDAGDKNKFGPVAVLGNDVFWTRTGFDERDYPGSQIKRRSDGGGPASVVFAGDFGVAQLNSTFPFAVDTTGIYMTANEAGRNPHLFRVPLAGGGLQRVRTFGDNDWARLWLRDAGRLFLMDDSENVNETLVAVLDDGQSLQRTLAVLPRSVTLQAMDEASLYLTDSKTIYQVAKEGGTVTPIFTSEMPLGIDHLLVDEQRLYFITTQRNEQPTLRSLDKRSGYLRSLASGRTFLARKLVHDADLIYVLHDNGKKISVVAKSPIE